MEASGQFLPGGTRRGVEGTYPPETVALPPEGLMPAGLRDAGKAGAEGIMASALIPHFRGRRKKFPQHKGHFRGDQDRATMTRRPGPTGNNTSSQERMFR